MFFLNVEGEKEKVGRRRLAGPGLASQCVVEGAVLWYMYVGWGYGYFEMMEGSGGA
jgi:hypothetical protein